MKSLKDKEINTNDSPNTRDSNIFLEKDVKKHLIEILKTSIFKGNAYLIKKSDWNKIIGNFKK